MKKNGKKDAQKNVSILSANEHVPMLLRIVRMLLRAVRMNLRRKFLN